MVEIMDQCMLAPPSLYPLVKILVKAGLDKIAVVVKMA